MDKNRFPTKEEFDKWIEALEGGQFKKGQRALYSEEAGGYCCLGVAQRVLRIDSASNSVLRDTRVHSAVTNYFLLPYSMQSVIAGVNDSVDTFQEPIKVLKRWADEGVIKFGEFFE